MRSQCIEPMILDPNHGLFATMKSLHMEACRSKVDRCKTYVGISYAQQIYFYPIYQIKIIQYYQVVDWIPFFDLLIPPPNTLIV